MVKQLAIFLAAGVILGTTTWAGAALLCQPATQTIFIGGTSENSSQGGDGTYRWDVSAGAVKVDGVANYVIYKWLTAGTESVSVSSGGEIATCVVYVQDPGATIVVLDVTKEARNVTGGQVVFTPTVSVWRNQIIEVSVRVAPTSQNESGPYRVIDALPSGMSYVPGSTKLNGGPFVDPVRTANGLEFRTFPIGLSTAALVAYRLVSDNFEVVLESPESFAFQALVTDEASGANDQSAVTLNLYGRGPGTTTAGRGFGQIPTGPGDATTIAFIAAIISSLLYAAYTRTASFHGREVRRIGRDQGPMDFRG